jgi:hypothetical protein
MHRPWAPSAIPNEEKILSPVSHYDKYQPYRKVKQSTQSILNIHGFKS